MSRNSPLPPRNYSSDVSYVRRLAQVVEGIMNGKTNNGGTFTLTASATSTTVSNERVGAYSKILFSPTTANAATALMTAYVSAVANGEFTVTHTSAVSVDRTYNYVLIG